MTLLSTAIRCRHLHLLRSVGIKLVALLLLSLSISNHSSIEDLQLCLTRSHMEQHAILCIHILHQVPVTPAQGPPPPAPVSKKVVKAAPATAEIPESDRSIPVKTQLERHDYDSMTRGELLLNCKRLVSQLV